MDQLVIVMLAVVAIYILLRLRSTFRRNRSSDKGDQIRRRLEELRKKRDEE